MPAIAYDGVVLLGLLYLMWLASDKGIVATSIAAAEVFVSLSLAVVLYEPIAGFVFTYLDENLAFFLPESISLEKWSIFLVFSLLMWGTLAALWVLVHPKLLPSEEEEVEAGMPILDKAGAALIGLYAGNLLLGAALITWSMCPLLWTIPTKDMFLDVGRTALKSTGRFLGEWHGGRSIPLHGEPVASRSDREALLSSEAFNDLNFDGKGGFDEPFYDADGDAAFTGDLYYLDVDGDRRRRVGVIEKYAVGLWDMPMVLDRQREDNKPKLPAEPKIPTSTPAPQNVAGGKKPEATEKVMPKPDPLISPLDQKPPPLPSTLFAPETPAAKKDAPVSDF